MAITEVIPAFTTSPSRQDPINFSADMDIRLNEENSRITSMNTQSSQMNTTADEVNTNAIAASDSATASATSATASQTAQTASEAAQALSESARDASIVAKDASVAAQGLSQAAQAASELAATSAINSAASVDVSVMGNRADLIANTHKTRDNLSSTATSNIVFNPTIKAVFADGKNSNNALVTKEATFLSTPNFDMTGNATTQITILLDAPTTVSTVLTGDTSGATGTVTFVMGNYATLDTLSGVFIEGETLNTATFTLGSIVVDYNKRYIRINDLGNISFSERPLNSGKNRKDADKWGEYTDSRELTKTTARHGTYESETGVVSASSHHAAYPPYFAFNKQKGSTAVSWLSLTGTLIGWLNYATSEARVLTSYSINGEDTVPARSPKDWTLEASNTGEFNGEEVVLDTQSAQVFTAGETKDYSFVNSTKYKYYRLDITLNNGDINYVGIGELELNFAISDEPYLNTETNEVLDATDTKTYLCELGSTKVDGQNNTYGLENYEPNKVHLNELEVHGTAKFNQAIEGVNQINAMAVSSDANTAPVRLDRLIGVEDIILVSTGNYDVITTDHYAMNSCVMSANTDQSNVGASIYQIGTNKFRVLPYVASTGAPYKPTWLSVIISGGVKL